MSDAIYGMPGAGPWMAPLVLGVVALGFSAWAVARRVWRKRLQPEPVPTDEYVLIVRKCEECCCHLCGETEEKVWELDGCGFDKEFCAPDFEHLHEWETTYFGHRSDDESKRTSSEAALKRQVLEEGKAPVILGWSLSSDLTYGRATEAEVLETALSLRGGR